MRIERSLADGTLDCDECGKPTKIIYSVRGDKRDEGEYTIVLCYRCLRSVPNKVRAALDLFSIDSKEDKKQTREVNV